MLRPLYLQGKAPRYPMGGRMGPTAALDLRSRVPLPGIEPQVLGRLALCVIPILTELPRPWLCLCIHGTSNSEDATDQWRRKVFGARDH